MRLFEFDGTDSIATQIIAVTDQLKTDLESGKINSTWTVDQLLSYYRKYGVSLDKTDLYNMIQQQPMKSVISNIQGDTVIFKGQEQSKVIDAPPTDDKKVVKQMAKRAVKI
jgi:hypothetical protein